MALRREGISAQGNALGVAKDIVGIDPRLDLLQTAEDKAVAALRKDPLHPEKAAADSKAQLFNVPAFALAYLVAAPVPFWRRVWPNSY